MLRVLDESGADLAAVSRFTHVSTVRHERTPHAAQARAGLLTTAGFPDVLILGRADRDHDIFDMRCRHPAPPTLRAMIREVPERMVPEGEILAPIDLDAGWREAEALMAAGAEGLAI